MKTLQEAFDDVGSNIALKSLEDCLWNEVKKFASVPIRRLDLWLEIHSSVWGTVNSEMLLLFITEYSYTNNLLLNK